MYEFKVEGMTCEGCVRSVTKAIQSMDSKARVKVELDKKKVLVESSRGEAEIRASIEGAGYDVLESRANA